MKFINYKKYIGTVLLLTFIPSMFFSAPKRTEAFLGIVDVGVSVDPFVISKETIWDTIAYFVAKRVMHSLTDGMVSWINSGFEGNPTFITNSLKFWKDTANEASGILIEKLGATGLCRPFSAQINLALRRRSPFNVRMRCTADDIADNFERSFASAGGWNGWIRVTTQPQNNIYGAYITSLAELERQKAEAIESAKSEQQSGKGFIGLKVCSDSFRGAKNTSTEDRERLDQIDGQIQANQKTISDYEEYLRTHPELNARDKGDYEGRISLLTDINDNLQAEIEEINERGGQVIQNNPCKNWKTTTPGSVVSKQLEDALGSDLAALRVADELNEVAATLINKMVSWVVTGGSDNNSGLLGQSNPKNRVSAGANDEVEEARLVSKLRRDATAALNFEKKFAREAAGYSSLRKTDVRLLTLLSECYRGEEKILREHGVSSGEELETILGKKEDTLADLADSSYRLELLETDDNIKGLSEVIEILNKEVRTNEDLSLASSKYSEVQPNLHTDKELKGFKFDIGIIQCDNEFCRLAKEIPKVASRVEACNANLEILRGRYRVTSGSSAIGGANGGSPAGGLGAISTAGSTAEAKSASNFVKQRYEELFDEEVAKQTNTTPSNTSTTTSP